MAELKVGDVVWHQSGGPKMTISEIENDIYTCQWFDNKKKLQTAFFSEKELISKDSN